MSNARIEAPPHVPSRLVVDFDHYESPALGEDPFGRYVELGRQHRIFYSTHYGGYWVLTRHADIHEVMLHPDLWSSRLVSVPAFEHTGGTRPLISLDPPEHTRHRRAINPVFAPAQVDALEASIRSIAVTLTEQIAGMDECDFLEDFARPMPARLFTTMFGFPVEEWRRFMDWDDALMRNIADRERISAEVGAYLRTALEARKANPGNDIISALLTPGPSGEPLDDDAVLSLAFQIFAAGFETVTTSLMFAFRYLALHPDQRQSIIDDPSLIPAAVDELLRAHPVSSPTRTATRDQTLAGAEIRAGDRLLLLLTASGYDPDAFDDPGRVDFGRGPTRHLTFGGGVHRCVGAPLARRELCVALEEWHRRIPEYKLVPGTGSRSIGGGALALTDLRLRLPASADYAEIDPSPSAST